MGQMCEITVDVITDFPGSKDGFKLSEAMLDTVIGKYKVGSILNVPLSVAQKEVMGCCNPSNSGEVDEGDRDSLYLWSRPDSWNYLYA